MAVPIGDIKLSANFEVNVSKPIDARFHVSNITERDNIDFKYYGMVVYVNSENKHYWYTNTNTWSDEFGNIIASHIKNITSTQISNWDTAFGWGDHASVGYTTIGGSNTQLQYNNNGVLGGLPIVYDAILDTITSSVTEAYFNGLLEVNKDTINPQPDFKLFGVNSGTDVILAVYDEPFYTRVELDANLVITQSSYGIKFGDGTTQYSAGIIGSGTDGTIPIFLFDVNSNKNILHDSTIRYSNFRLHTSSDFEFGGKLYMTSSGSPLDNTSILNAPYFYSSGRGIFSKVYTDSAYLGVGMYMESIPVGTITSGTRIGVLMLNAVSFNPTSGNSTHTNLEIRSSIDQSGTSTGITRGIHLYQTTLNAPDYRGIEVNMGASSHWGYYQSGANAKNYIHGSLSIGATASNLAKVLIRGIDALASTNSLLVQNSAQVALLTIANDGTITLSKAPTADLHAATKKYVDDAITTGSYTNAMARAAISETIAGIDYNSMTGVFSMTSGYFIPTTTEQSNWNNAFFWGNHANAGYLTSFTETDPAFNAWLNTNPFTGYATESWVTSQGYTGVGGSNTQLQYNNNGVLGGLPSVYNSSQNRLSTQTGFEVTSPSNNYIALYAPSQSGTSEALLQMLNYGNHSDIELYQYSIFGSEKHKASVTLEYGELLLNVLTTDTSNNSVISDKYILLTNDTLTITYLNGTGTRMVVADDNGVISTQPLPNFTGYATESWVISQGYLVATSTDKTNWNTAYSWGNHLGLYKDISYVPDWSDITGKPTLGTISTQNANNVTITGGTASLSSITNTSIADTQLVYSANGVMTGSDLVTYNNTDQRVVFGDTPPITTNARVIIKGQAGGTGIGNQILRLYASNNNLVFSANNNSEASFGRDPISGVAVTIENSLAKTTIFSLRSSLSSNLFTFGATGDAVFNANNIISPFTQIRLTANFVPTTNVGYTAIEIASTINQDVTTNAATYGIRVNPTLTFAPNWTSIRTDNNVGYQIYAAGTAPSYFGGRIRIGALTSGSAIIRASNAEGLSSFVSFFSSGTTLVYDISATGNIQVAGGDASSTYMSSSNVGAVNYAQQRRSLTGIVAKGIHANFTFGHNNTNDSTVVIDSAPLYINTSRTGLQIHGIRSINNASVITTTTNHVYAGFFNAIAGTGNTTYAGYFSATGGTINYGIYVESGESYFGGNIVVGGTASFSSLTNTSIADTQLVYSANGVQTGTNYITYDAVNGRLGIRTEGGSTYYGQLWMGGTTPASAATRLYVKAYTSDLFVPVFEIHKANNNVLFRVYDTGRVNFADGVTLETTTSTKSLSTNQAAFSLSALGLTLAMQGATLGLGQAVNISTPTLTNSITSGGDNTARIFHFSLSDTRSQGIFKYIGQNITGTINHGVGTVFTSVASTFGVAAVAVETTITHLESQFTSFYATPTITSVGTNGTYYAFRTTNNLIAGDKSWAFYSSGTAPSYFNGRLNIGSTGTIAQARQFYSGNSAETRYLAYNNNNGNLATISSISDASITISSTSGTSELSIGQGNNMILYSHHATQTNGVGWGTWVLGNTASQIGRNVYLLFSSKDATSGVTYRSYSVHAMYGTQYWNGSSSKYSGIVQFAQRNSATENDIDLKFDYVTNQSFELLGGTTNLVTLKATGAFLIGTSTAIGTEKLRVNGTSYFDASVGIGITPTAKLHIKGDGITSGTVAFLVQNGTPTNLLRVNDIGTTTLTSTQASNDTLILAGNLPYIYFSEAGSRLRGVSGGFTFTDNSYNPIVGWGGAATGGFTSNRKGLFNAASSSYTNLGFGFSDYAFRIDADYGGIVGNTLGGEFHVLRVNPSLRYGGTGVVYGINITPTFNSAPDFSFKGVRINLDNVNQYGFVQDGSSSGNYAMGWWTIGSNTRIGTEKLRVNGTSYFDDSVGIGAVPTAKLHIKSSTSDSIPAFLLQNSNNVSLISTDSAGNTFMQTSGASNVLTLRSSVIASAYFAIEGVGTPGNNDGAAIRLRKAEGTYTSLLNISNGRVVSRILWEGYFNGYITGASLVATVDSTSSAGIMPMRLVFSTMNSAGTLTEALRINSSQNVGIATDTVNARLHVRGSGIDSSNAFLIQNSTPTDLFAVRENGVLKVGGGSYGQSTIMYSVDAGTGGVGNLSTTGTKLVLYSMANGTTVTGVNIGDINFGGEPQLNSTGHNNHIYINRPFRPTSGTGTLNLMHLTGDINQSGGANGIVRSLLISHTIVAAADYRAIETTNNVGYQLYVSGIAPSYFGGNVSIGATTASAKLHIKGDGNTSFLIQKSDNTQLLKIDDNSITFSTGAVFTFSTGVFSRNGNYTFDNSTAALSGGRPFGLSVANSAGISESASSEVDNFRIVMTDTRATNTIFYNGINVSGVINSVSGKHRGIYINPTLTATADYRGLEIVTSNISHYGIKQTGAAGQNKFDGYVLIGGSTDTVPNANTNWAFVAQPFVGQTKVAMLGNLEINTNETGGGWTGASINVVGTNRTLHIRGANGSNISDVSSVNITSNPYNLNASLTEWSQLRISQGSVWVPSSGSINLNGLLVDLTTNQSGTATGNIFGVRTRHTIISQLGNYYAYYTDNAAITGDKSWAFYSAGTAPSYFGGNIVGSTASLTGTGTTVSTTVFRTNDSAGLQTFGITDDASTSFHAKNKDYYLRVTPRSFNSHLITAYWAGSTAYGINISANASSVTSFPTGYGISLGNSYSIDITATSVNDLVRVSSSAFNPTSGTAVLNFFAVRPNVQQVGSTGETTGILIDPAGGFSAADYKALKITNNTGYQIFASGTAPSYFNGRLNIGSTGTLAQASTFSAMNSAETMGINLTGSTFNLRGTSVSRLNILLTASGSNAELVLGSALLSGIFGANTRGVSDASLSYSGISGVSSYNQYFLIGSTNATVSNTFVSLSWGLAHATQYWDSAAGLARYSGFLTFAQRASSVPDDIMYRVNYSPNSAAGVFGNSLPTVNGFAVKGNGAFLIGTLTQVDTEKLRVNGTSYFDDSVGIGVTPTAKLHVRSSGNTTGTILALQNSTPDTVFQVYETGSFMLRNPTGTSTSTFPLNPTGNMFYYAQNKGSITGGRNTIPGIWSEANIGTSSLAWGEESRASGTNSVALVSGIASGSNSVSIGQLTAASGVRSTTIGFWAKSTATGGITIGSGVTTNADFINNTSSIWMGNNSDTPTLVITPANGIGTTGSVGIGVTPTAKLHVRSSGNTTGTILALQNSTPDTVFQVYETGSFLAQNPTGTTTSHAPAWGGGLGRKYMYYAQDKGALSGGVRNNLTDANIGNASIAWGQSIASGDYAVALSGGTASGYASTAIGEGVSTSGSYSVALGSNLTASSGMMLGIGMSGSNKPTNIYGGLAMYANNTNVAILHAVDTYQHPGGVYTVERAALSLMGGLVDPVTANYVVQIGGHRKTGVGRGSTAVGTLLNSTLEATANNDTLIGLHINPTYTLNSFTGVNTYGLYQTGTAPNYLRGMLMLNDTVSPGNGNNANLHMKHIGTGQGWWVINVIDSSTTPKVLFRLFDTGAITFANGRSFTPSTGVWTTSGGGNYTVDMGSTITGGAPFIFKVLSRGTSEVASGSLLSNLHVEMADTRTTNTAVVRGSYIDGVINTTTGKLRGHSVEWTLTNAAEATAFYTNINASAEKYWAFYAAGTAPSFFGGNLGIGTTTINAKLHIKGAGSTSATRILYADNSVGNVAIDVRDNLGIGLGSPRFGTIGNRSVVISGVDNSSTASGVSAIAIGTYHANSGNQCTSLGTAVTIGSGVLDSVAIGGFVNLSATGTGNYSVLIGSGHGFSSTSLQYSANNPVVALGARSINPLFFVGNTYSNGSSPFLANTTVGSKTVTAGNSVYDFTTLLRIGDAITVGGIPYIVESIVDALTLTTTVAQTANNTNASAYWNSDLMWINNGAAVRKITVNKSGWLGINTSTMTALFEVNHTSISPTFAFHQKGNSALNSFEGNLIINATTLIGTEKLRVNGMSYFDNTLIFKDGANLSFGSTAGSMIGISSADRIGFWGVTPVVQDTGWIVNNLVSSIRNIDVATATLADLREVVGTLITTLKTIGLLG